MARDYYANYVAAEIQRHLSFLAGGDTPWTMSAIIPERVQWTAAAVPAALVVDGRVSGGEAFRAGNRAVMRWAGGFDLRRLAALPSGGIASDALIKRLQGEGLGEEDARNALHWALRYRLLAPYPYRE